MILFFVMLALLGVGVVLVDGDVHWSIPLTLLLLGALVAIATQ